MRISSLLKRGLRALKSRSSDPHHINPEPSLTLPEQREVKMVDDFVWIDEQAISEDEARERQYVTDKLKEFSLTETLAHTSVGAYGAPKRPAGSLVQLSDIQTGEDVQYNAISIKTEASGLFGEIFVPADPSTSQNIYVNWTGTYSLGTLLADLEIAPGEESYRKEEQSILSQINDAVKSFAQTSGKKAKIMVTGHSLGGALAQMNMHSIQRAISTDIYEQKLEQGDLETCAAWVKAEQSFRTNIQSGTQGQGNDLPESIRSHLTAEHVASISLGSWNSAGVMQAVEDSSNALAPVLSKGGVKQSALFGMVAGDGVQATGQGTVFSNVKQEDVDINLIKMDKELEEGFYTKAGLSPLGAAAMTTGSIFLGAPTAIAGGLAVALGRFSYSTGKAHTSKHFQEVGIQVNNFNMYNNHSPEGKKIVDKKLKNKSSFLQAPPVRAIQKGLYYVFNQFVDAKKHGPTCSQQAARPERRATPAV